MRETGITWTDSTFNSWWGCARVSPGCENCYAETFAKRTGHAVWGVGAGRREFGDKHWNEPRKWNAAAEKSQRRHRVFCASMADVFDLNAPPGARERLFALIRETPWLDWQLLTKRPQNVLAMLPADWGDGYENVWLGCTAEDQKRADERLPILISIPAKIRFVSYEPALEAVDFSSWIQRVDHCKACGNESAPQSADRCPICRHTSILISTWGDDQAEAMRTGSRDPNAPGADGPQINWIIIGGESGPHARPFDPAWALDVIAQCDEAGIEVFMKQMGEPWAKANGAKQRHGADPMEWDPEYRVQEFPMPVVSNLTVRS